MPLPNTTIVGSGLIASLQTAGYFPAVVIIKAHDGTLNRMNEPDLSPANFDPVSGLESLKGRLTPLEAREVRAEGFESALATWQLMLNGLYPTVTDLMIADVDGTFYNIEGVGTDGGGTFTRLQLELSRTT